MGLQATSAAKGSRSQPTNDVVILGSDDDSDDDLILVESRVEVSARVFSPPAAAAAAEESEIRSPRFGTKLRKIDSKAALKPRKR